MPRARLPGATRTAAAPLDALLVNESLATRAAAAPLDMSLVDESVGTRAGAAPPDAFFVYESLALPMSHASLCTIGLLRERVPRRLMRCSCTNGCHASCRHAALCLVLCVNGLLRELPDASFVHKWVAPRAADAALCALFVHEAGATRASAASFVHDRVAARAGAAPLEALFVHESVAASG